MALCLDTEQLETVQRILNLHFEGVEVWAYGPRVNGTDCPPDMDLELVVISEKPISFEDMTAVEKAFVESELPFRVDIIDWAKLPESLQKQIKKDHDVVQAANAEA
ncbi:MAG: nucleotidyltransferase domain-containing protein [Fibrobacter sp.]|jgi:hypothetical protein|uniref:nucleotidyltransferase domain-containing protein n=1 Tax=uncultured Fibrobacter sp. TaxID=261512 RepID=UPI001B0D7ADA|nr:nucleotidyltransferase domain-containing protein [uncultured Fibrobacter sp.]MBO7550986.1 nucleotidyltransferase domain-containing protein [Fibrobacter sp.]